MKLEQTIYVRDQHRVGVQSGSVARRTGKHILLFLSAAAVCFALTTGVVRLLQSADRGLPYHDGFVSSDITEWTAYGGNWKVQDGTMVNESNERGAKLVTGSAYWK